MSLKCTMILGDCLEVMPTLPKKGAQMCFADLPYGVTGFDWDIAICAKTFWSCNAAVNAGPLVITANESFHIKMLDAWRKKFRYSLIWEKLAPCNFLQAKLRPMVSHEFVAIYGPTPVYNPQKTYGHPPVKKTGDKVPSAFVRGYVNLESGKRKDLDDSRLPRSILYFRRDKRKRDYKSGPDVKLRNNTHSSQKPVALLDWLIRTYSNAGDTILDPVSGSGTTAVAALSCGRHVTCIEKDASYFGASVERVRKHVKDNSLDVCIEIVT